MAIEFACPRCHLILCRELVQNLKISSSEAPRRHLMYYLNVVGIETHLQEYRALEVTRRIRIMVQNIDCSQNKVEPELENRIQDVNNLFKTCSYI